MAGFAGLATVSLAATGSAARVELPASVGVPNLANTEEGVKLRGMLSARVMCMPGTLAANDVVYIAFGDSSIVATAANGTPLVPGLVELHTLQPGETHMSALISGATTSTVYATVGQEMPR